MRRVLLAGLGLLLLGGCVTLPPRPPPGAGLPLLAPAAMGAPRSATQVLRVAFADRQATLQSALNLEPELLTLVGISTIGTRLFTLRYDGVAVTAETGPGIPDRLDPQRVLADVQLAYAPLAVWAERLAGSPWQVTEPGPGLRRLRRGGVLVAEVHYGGADPWRDPFWVANFEYGYSLAVQPLP